MQKFVNFIWTNRSWGIRIFAGLVIFVALGLGIRSCYYSWSSNAYWEESAEYKKKLSDWEIERKGYKTQIAERDKKITERDKVIADALPKALAFDGLAEQHKAADPKLVQQIEEVSKSEKEKLDKAEQPTKCWDRVQSVCDMLRARKPRYDCAELFRENCG